MLDSLLGDDFHVTTLPCLQRSIEILCSSGTVVWRRINRENGRINIRNLIPSVPSQNIINMNQLTRLFAFAFVSVLLLTARCRAMEAARYFADSNVLALARAAVDGDSKLIDKSLAKGASPNAIGKKGMTPLLWALVNQSLRGYEHLLTCGGNPNLALNDERSIIAFAAMLKDSRYHRATLEHGGDPNLPNRLDNLYTPIYYALFSLRPENVRLLIKGGANLNWKSSSGETPLMLAAIVNRYDIVFEMLHAGVDPRIINVNGETILSIIRRFHTNPASEMWHWRMDVIRLLKAKGLDVEHGR